MRFLTGLAIVAAVACVAEFARGDTSLPEAAAFNEAYDWTSEDDEELVQAAPNMVSNTFHWDANGALMGVNGALLGAHGEQIPLKRAPQQAHGPLQLTNHPTPDNEIQGNTVNAKAAALQKAKSANQKVKKAKKALKHALQHAVKKANAKVKKAKKVKRKAEVRALVKKAVAKAVVAKKGAPKKQAPKPAPKKASKDHKVTTTLKKVQKPVAKGASDTGDSETINMDPKCRDGKPKAKSCKWYKEQGGGKFCNMRNSRRRQWGGDAKDNCRKTCGLCIGGGEAQSKSDIKQAQIQQRKEQNVKVAAKNAEERAEKKEAFAKAKAKRTQKLKDQAESKSKTEQKKDHEIVIKRREAEDSKELAQKKAGEKAHEQELKSEKKEKAQALHAHEQTLKKEKATKNAMKQEQEQVNKNEQQEKNEVSSKYQQKKEQWLANKEAGVKSKLRKQAGEMAQKSEKRLKRDQALATEKQTKRNKAKEGEQKADAKIAAEQKRAKEEMTKFNQKMATQKKKSQELSTKNAIAGKRAQAEGLKAQQTAAAAASAKQAKQNAENAEKTESAPAPVAKPAPKAKAKNAVAVQSKAKVTVHTKKLPLVKFVPAGKAAASCADGKPKFQTCAYYSKKFCSLARTSRRRGFGGDAADNCKATCKLCAAGAVKETKMSAMKCFDTLKTCSHYQQHCNVADRMMVTQKLDGKVVAHDVLAKLCPKTCNLCDKMKPVAKPEAVVCADNPRPIKAKSCAWYKVNRVCAFASASRRRGWGGDARDNCAATCGLCKKPQAANLVEELADGLEANSSPWYQRA